MEKVLISACLLGQRVRYDGGAKALRHPLLARWEAEGRLVPVCPEVAGGLPTPRPPAERMADGSIRTAAGADVSAAFHAGAAAALAVAREHGVRIALLKERSPSCGSAWIYDGSFSGTLQAGQGITAALLRAHGVLVFSEEQLEQAASALEALERGGQPA
jgi:uncharacterized protein YbbK (DUF523 family)